MSILFTVNEHTVYPFPETLLVSPFKEIWERDEDVGKHNALEEFAYIEFMSSKKKTNHFRNYEDVEKHDAIVGKVITQKDWQPDGLIFEAIEVVEEFKKKGSLTYAYFTDAKVALEEVRRFLRTVDLDERTKSGAPVYKAKEVTATLIDTDKLLANFDKLMKKLDEEDFEETKNRGGAMISPFANPDTMRED